MKLDPAQLNALAAILRTGSFEAAAGVLNVSPPAISQRIRALEERLGAPVVTRSTPVEATDVGARLAHHADHVALLEAELARDLGQRAAPGRVRIAVNADSLDTWFLKALEGTELQVEIIIDDQAHSIDWLRSGKVSAAVTDHASAVQGCTAHPLGALRYHATAHPSFMARWFAGGLTIEALSQAPMLQFSHKDRIQHDWLAAFAGRPLAPPTHILPSTVGFVEACTRGLAWGLNPAPLISAPLASGALVQLDPMPWDTPLYWQVSRLVAEPLSALTRAVRRAARASLVPAGDGA
ncbi:LysR family transcriptional regulator ArgP [Roseobacteraceae bacterium S113]